MMKKRDLIQYFILIYFYAVLIVGGMVNSLTSNMREYGRLHHDEELIAQADLIQNCTTWLFILGIVLFVVWSVYDYEKTRTICVSTARMNFFLRDIDHVEEWQSVGISKHDPVKLSSSTIEKIMNDPELTDMFDKIEDGLKKRFKNQITEDLDQNAQKILVSDDPEKSNKIQKPANEKRTTKPEKKMIIRDPNSISFNVELNEEDIDFSKYPIEFFYTKEFDCFFTDQQKAYLHDKSVNQIGEFDDSKWNEFCELKKEDIKTIEKNYFTIHKETPNFTLIQDYMKNCFNIFYQKEVKWLKSNGINTFENLRTSDLSDLEKQFNSFFNTSKNPLSKRAKYYELKNEIKKITGLIISRESQYIFYLSPESKFKYINLKTAKLKAMYYKYRAYLCYFDEYLTFCTDVTDPSFLDPNVRQKTYIQVNKVLMILPASWNDSFRFQKQRIIFNGHIIVAPSVANASFVYVSMLTHDVAIFFCSSCDYMQSSIWRQLTIKSDILESIKQMAYAEMIYKQHALAKRLKEKIRDRDQQIIQFRKEKDDKFLNNEANTDMSKFKVSWGPPTKISGFMITLIIIIAIMCFLIGFMIQNPAQT